MVKIPVHLFPKMPFIGETVSAVLVNLSAGGMALTIDSGMLNDHPISRKAHLKIHFRLPGKPLQGCKGVVTHILKNDPTKIFIGIRFESCPEHLAKEIEAMAADNEACDYRIEQTKDPWCVPNCAFFELCRKPIRPAAHHASTMDRLEIALQSNE